MNWMSLFTAYEPCYAHHSHNTRYLTRRWLERFQAFCEAQSVAVHQVRFSHLEAFQAQLLWTQGSDGQLFTANTVYQAVRMVRAFLRWAVQQGHVPEDPTCGWILRRPVTVRRSVSPDEVRRLLRALDTDSLSGVRMRAMVAVLVGTGVRTGELQRLILDDVDLEASTITVRLGKVRTLPLAAELMDIVATYLVHARPRLASRPEEGALFIGADGRALGTTRMNQLLVHAGREAGLSGGTPLALRNSFADQARADGVGEKALRLLLGIGHPPAPPAPPRPKKPPAPRLYARPDRRKKVS